MRKYLKLLPLGLIIAPLVISGLRGIDVALAAIGSDVHKIQSPVVISDDGEGDVTHTYGGTDFDSTLEIHQTGGTEPGGLTVHRHANSAVLGGEITFLKSRGTHNSPTVVQDGNAIMRLLGAGYDGTDYEFSSEIRFSVDGTPADSANDMPGSINFYTTPDGSGTLTEALRIDASQNTNILSQKELRFQDTTGGEYMGFKAPSSVTSSTSFTLPDGDGNSGQVLSTNGSATLSWTDANGEGKNYFSAINARFEGGSGNWEEFDDASAYVDGTGGTASNISFTTTTTSGQYIEALESLALTKDAANAQYEGISVVTTTIDAQYAENSAPLHGSFWFRPGSNYTSGDLKLFAYCSTGDTNEILGVSSNDKDNEIPNRFGEFQFTVHLNENCTVVRVSLMINTSGTTGWTSYLDDFKLGPDILTVAKFTKGWKEYTLTIGATTTPPTPGTNTSKAYWRRDGENMEIMYSFVQSSSGSAGTGTYLFPIPSGYTIDTSKFATSASSSQSDTAGAASVFNGSINLDGWVEAASTTELQVFVGADTVAIAQVGASHAALSGSTILYSFRAVVPIVGWANGNLMSTHEKSVSTVMLKVSGDPASATAANPIIFPTESYDDFNAYDNTTGIFTAPKAGRYQIKGYIASTNAAVGTSAYVNGSSVSQLGNTDSNGEAVMSGTVDVEKGDTISVRPGGTLDAQNGSTLYIEAMPDFSVIGAYRPYELEDTSTASTTYGITVDEWGDFGNVSLTPGTWNCFGHVTYHANGAVTTTTIGLGISATSGNTAPSGGQGVDYMLGTKATTSGTYDSLAVSLPGITVTSKTTYYLKGFAATSVTNLDAGYRFYCKRDQ